ncbi:MAG: cyclic nucleotide-binding domain-containing protein [Pseudomonas sp.]|uniref:cyclic nucleotide-binding domain-containing protein n=1 Tax=Pseudomonas sp. TaxID=306 RepID=UPI002732A4DA|nr:cyclic nucleotide-binding domain-containing protein [Pseudomonas sp.]MDP3846088.1 cyclic nucleotide-binding domain-containing protein [Pseudomonas sp.]
MTNSTPRLSLEGLRQFSPIDFLTPHYLQQLLDSLQYVEHQAGSVLLRRGENSLALYFLLEGEVWLGNKKLGRSIQAGSPEASRALNENQPQAIDVAASSDVRLMAVERGLLERLLSWSQSASYEVASLQEEQPHAESDDWLSKLLRSPLFGRLPPAHLHLLLARFEFVEVQAGDCVVHYGEPGEHFYVIKQGRALISLPASYQQPLQPELHRGDFFGEEALVSGSVRAASITMLEDGVLARLQRNLFIELVRPTLIPQINATQLQQLTAHGNKNSLLLDIRLPMEYRMAHVPASMNLPLAQLRQQAANLDNTTLYAVLPEGGVRSELAVHLLNQLGFEAYLLTEQPGQAPVAA